MKDNEPKPDIYYSIINAVADLPGLHNLSDAGAGAGLMGYTPASNTEMIVTGQDITPLPGVTPAPLLSNGGITPALLVYGLLKLLKEQGHRVFIRVYNIGLPIQPRLPESLENVQQWHCQSHQVEQLLEQHLLPNLKQESQDHAISLLAECGVGSTTFSSLWLSLLLNDNFAMGSTSLPEKLARKRQLIQKLKQQVQDTGKPVSTRLMLQNPAWHDSFQALLVPLLKKLPQVLREDRPVWLSGGLMFIAPLLMLASEQKELASALAEHTCQATTRWVYSYDHGTEKLLGIVRNSLNVLLPITDFNQSRHQCLRLYEQGLVVEGCGLGACLVLAEQLGVHSDTILHRLDTVVDLHFSKFATGTQTV